MKVREEFRKSEKAVVVYEYFESRNLYNQHNSSTTHVQAFSFKPNSDLYKNTTIYLFICKNTKENYLAISPINYSECVAKPRWTSAVRIILYFPIAHNTLFAPPPPPPPNFCINYCFQILKGGLHILKTIIYA